MIYIQLFLRFLQIGLFSIGGGYAAIPLIQHQAVDVCGWLSMDEFTNLVTIAEMTPGPIAVNASTFVGIRIAGIGGALAATGGCIFPSCLIVSLLAFLYRSYRELPLLQNILSCLRSAVVACIACAGLSILNLVLFRGETISFAHTDWTGAAIFLAAFLLLRKWKWNPILVMCLCGVAGLCLNLFIPGGI
jgi:chromate transporter